MITHGPLGPHGKSWKLFLVYFALENHLKVEINHTCTLDSHLPDDDPPLSFDLPFEYFGIAVIDLVLCRHVTLDDFETQNLSFLFLE